MADPRARKLWSSLTRGLRSRAPGNTPSKRGVEAEVLPVEVTLVEPSESGSAATYVPLYEGCDIEVSVPTFEDRADRDIPAVFHGGPALLPGWTDTDAAIEAVARRLGVPASVVQSDSTIRNGLFDVLLSLVEVDVLEMFGSAEAGYDFRNREQSEGPVIHGLASYLDMTAPPPSDELHRLQTELDDALHRHSEALHRGALAEAASQMREGERDEAVRRAEVAEATARECLVERDEALQREASLRAEVMQREAGLREEAEQREAELSRRAEAAESLARQHQGDHDETLLRESSLLHRLEVAEAAAQQYVIERDEALLRTKQAVELARERERIATAAAQAADSPATAADDVDVRGDEWRDDRDLEWNAPNQGARFSDAALGRSEEHPKVSSPHDVDVWGLWLNRAARKPRPAPRDRDSTH